MSLVRKIVLGGGGGGVGSVDSSLQQVNSVQTPNEPTRTVTRTSFEVYPALQVLGSKTHATQSLPKSVHWSVTHTSALVSPNIASSRHSPTALRLEVTQLHIIYARARRDVRRLPTSTVACGTVDVIE